MAVKLHETPNAAILEIGVLMFYYGVGYGRLVEDVDPDGWGFVVYCNGRPVARRAYDAGIELLVPDRTDCARGLLAGIGWWLAGGAA